MARGETPTPVCRGSRQRVTNKRVNHIGGGKESKRGEGGFAGGEHDRGVKESLGSNNSHHSKLEKGLMRGAKKSGAVRLLPNAGSATCEVSSLLPRWRKEKGKGRKRGPETPNLANPRGGGTSKKALSLQGNLTMDFAEKGGKVQGH